MCNYKIKAADMMYLFRVISEKLAQQIKSRIRKNGGSGERCCRKLFTQEIIPERNIPVVNTQ